MNLPTSSLQPPTAALQALRDALQPLTAALQALQDALQPVFTRLLSSTSPLQALSVGLGMPRHALNHNKQE